MRRRKQYEDKKSYYCTTKNTPHTKEALEKYFSIPGVLCDKRISFRLKGRVYQVIV